MTLNDSPAPAPTTGTHAPWGRSIRRDWPALLLAAIAGPFLLYGLGHYSLVNGDEEIYHVIARQMVESGDWLRLWFYEEHRIYDTFMNAPLQYWARALVISAFGSSEWTVRILSALCGVASVLMTYRLSLHLRAHRGVALLAGLVHLTTLQFVYLHGARTGELEPAVTLLYTAITLFFLKGLERGGPFIAHHVCLALLLNLKSPAILVPLLAEATCFALLPAARPSLRRFVVSGLMVLPFGVLWHVARMIELWAPFLEVMGRMAGEAAAHKNAFGDFFDSAFDTGPSASNAAFYTGTLLFGAYPYSIFYPLALVACLYRDGVRGLRDRARPDRLAWWVMAIFVVAVFIFYSLVSKHHRWYIMPMYPLLSVFVAHWLGDLWRKREEAPAWPALAAIALGGALLAFTRVNTTAYNPFIFKAWAIPMKTRWVDFMGLDPSWGVAVLGAGVLGALLGLRRAFGASCGPWLAATLAIGLLGYAGVRVALPLQYLDQRSPMARLSERLEGERAAAEAHGETIPYPIAVERHLEWDARFYLGDHYRIVPKGKKRFLLFPK